MTKLSIIICTFQRTHLLKWNLFSLARQNIAFDFETIVLNDAIPDETEQLCKQYRDKLNIRYIFTGQRNLDNEIKWRVPGFTFNIGVKQSSGDILILCNAEMFHVNDTVNIMSQPLLKHKKMMVIPEGRDDLDGAFLKALENNNGNLEAKIFINSNSVLYTRLPYLMALSREQFFAIGGYDEDFTGVAAEDSDLVLRLKNNGCSYCQTNARTIHLYHPRTFFYGVTDSPEYLHNLKLYEERQNQIIRNQNREWGKIEN